MICQANCQTVTDLPKRRAKVFSVISHTPPPMKRLFHAEAPFSIKNNNLSGYVIFVLTANLAVVKRLLESS